MEKIACRMRPGLPALLLVLTLLPGCGTLEQPTAPIDGNRPAGDAAMPAEAAAASGWYDAQMRVARSALKSGNYSIAARLFRKIRERLPNRFEPVLGLADSLYADRSFDAAVSAYNAALAMRPNDHQARRGLGEALVSAGRIGEGINHLAAALESGKDASLYNKLGVANELIGNTAEAQTYFRQGLELDPENLSLRNNLGLSLALSGDSEDAIDQLEQAARHPDATEQHRKNLAFVYAMAGDFDAAARIDGVTRTPEETAALRARMARVRELAEAGNRSGLLAMLNQRPDGRFDDIPASGGPTGIAAAEPETPSDAVTVEKLNEITPAAGPEPAAEAGDASVAETTPAAPVAVAEKPTPAGEGGADAAKPPMQAQSSMATLNAVEPAAGAPSVAAATPGSSGGMGHATRAARASGAIYRVQIGAYRNMYTSVRGRKILMKKAPGLLTDVEILIRTDAGARPGKINYRLRTAPLAGPNVARDLCTRLKALKIDCLAVRHSQTLWAAVDTGPGGAPMKRRAGGPPPRTPDKGAKTAPPAAGSGTGPAHGSL